MKIIQFIKTATLLAFFIIGSASFANAATDHDNPKKVKKEVKADKVQSTQWFVYSASSHPTNLTDASNPNNYTLVTDPSELCSGESNLCAIKAEVDMSNPSTPRPLIAGKTIQTELSNYFNPASPGYDDTVIVQKD